jgi:uncharacterized membrane protein
MKKNLIKTMTLIVLIFIAIPLTNSFGQEDITQKSQMLDIKLQLLDSKLELLDTKIKLWEAKPKELDIKLTELNSKINTMDFNPKQMTNKLNEIDSLFKVSQNVVVPVEKEQIAVIEPLAEPIPQFIQDYKSTIMFDPIRIMEGTFSLSYERVLDPRYSVNITGMATYSTKQGLSNYYFSNQSFALFDRESNQYNSYQGEVMSGGGVIVQFRNYLLANQTKRQKAPLGLYAAPQIMYRNMSITGITRQMVETTPAVFEMVDVKVYQHLNIFAGGVILGYKLSLFKVLAIDIFAGGNIKLSKYKNEDDFTKYKNMKNIDFSGVSPVAGIAIGILK